MSRPPIPPSTNDSDFLAQLRHEIDTHCPPSSAPQLPAVPQDCFEKEEDVTISTGTFHTYSSGQSGPLMVMIHGIGLSAMSFGQLALLLKGTARVFAPDLRGHGKSFTNDDENLDLNVITSDVAELVNTLFPKYPEGVILLGHSIGGSIVSKLAAENTITSVIKALFVIDIVEGTALESLSAMDSVLLRRPTHFNTLDDAVKWTGRNLIHGQLAASISAPSIFAPVDPSDPSAGYKWRMDAAKSKPFWRDWYKGLNKNFLSARCPRVLILASVDELDKEMNIANMQGKFQLCVIPNSGHHIHEERPRDVFNTIKAVLNKMSTVPQFRRS
ncbi:putative Protein phosphatase methylesterase 1 [Blattamonas nauphoetae]|uniref:Protein phosphatase methylesterase 1 n=1 Tax=Blattamonas nauphoetae TaxID=2049346 RepID=A0ABQ9XJ79_9EUKA|nr:putative Protein phosphatase methylesterase 1 [Blattamonas nauphoetae]